MLAFRTQLGALGLAAALFAAAPALATPIAANTGWVGDTLDVGGGATTGSPWTFTLAVGEKAHFKLTDFFITGDTFFLYDGATLLAESSAFAGTPHDIIGDANGEAGWTSASYEKIDYVFATAGSYSLTIKGDGVGGIPAGLYVRLDVPEPASLALVALALLGAGVTARRRS